MESEYDRANLLSQKSRNEGRVKNLYGRASVGLGATMIAFGCLAIIAQIVVLAVYNSSFYFQGIWCGIAVSAY